MNCDGLLLVVRGQWYYSAWSWHRSAKNINLRITDSSRSLPFPLWVQGSITTSINIRLNLNRYLGHQQNKAVHPHIVNCVRVNLVKPLRVILLSCRTIMIWLVPSRRNWGRWKDCWRLISMLNNLRWWGRWSWKHRKSMKYFKNRGDIGVDIVYVLTNRSILIDS